MKIVNIIGGLGNQMFQYAFAIALQEKWKEEVKIDTHHYNYLFSKYFHGNNFYHNGFEIDKIFPCAKLKRALVWDILKVSFYVPNFALSRIVRKILPKRRYEFLQKAKDSYIYDDKVFSDNKYRYYEGYWMSAHFFSPYRDIIKETYKFDSFTSCQNKEYELLLLKDNSVTIHVRRGDYLNCLNMTNICSLDYYRKAISKVKEQIPNPVFFIFSNDIEWCKENLKQDLEKDIVYFVTNNKGSESYRDMQLMSLARCNILANSSFSWWGAFLNDRNDQIVFAPNKWITNMNAEEMYLDEWIKL